MNLLQVLQNAAIRPLCRGNRLVIRLWFGAVLCLCGMIRFSWCDETLTLDALDRQFRTFGGQHENGDVTSFTWWLPSEHDELIVPVSGGVRVDATDPKLVQWLRSGSPWSLSDLPVIGARYGKQLAVIIVPWPLYAELVVEDRVGIRYSYPRDRKSATPSGLVVTLRDPDPLEVARAFRQWRRAGKGTGLVPPVRDLAEKIRRLPAADRLLGAPHVYLWGPPLFCKHDVRRGKWRDFALALQVASEDSVGRDVLNQFNASESEALAELCDAEWPAEYLTRSVAAGIQRGLLVAAEGPSLEPSATASSDASLIAGRASHLEAKKLSFANEYAGLLEPVDQWGDGLSSTMLNELHRSGLRRALLLLPDQHRDYSLRRLTQQAWEHGFLVAPYDSYHSVHAPNAVPDDTWETAQFDQLAFEQGRILREDGTGHAGFRGKGFHFSPRAAWPYVKTRVDSLQSMSDFSAWFVDCDALAEVFDDYHPLHPANRSEDCELRRARLSWLETDQRLVVGSEGGSALFSDVIHFGHGVHTPYIGHLDPAFRRVGDPSFLGRYFPR